MKMTRKIFALALAVMMIMSLAVPAFAAEDHNNHWIHISNDRDGYEYTAYQIFAGKVNDLGILTDPEWGDAFDEADIDDMLADIQTISGLEHVTDVDSIITALSDNAAKDDPETLAFADVVAEYAKNNGRVSVDSGSYYSISGLTDGYYLVKNTKVPDGNNTVYTRYILEVVANVNVNPKGTFPSVEKKIKEGDDLVDVNNAFIGEKVEYVITGSLPNTISYYNTYFYEFVDTMSKGLTYNNDMEIYVNGVEVTGQFDIQTAAYTGADANYAGGTVITATIIDLLSLQNIEGVGTITGDTQVVVEYSATLNEKAVINYEGNPNKIKVRYDNDPNDDGYGTPGETPEDEVRTFTTQLNLQKVDAQGNALTGATFNLTSDTNVKITVVTYYTFTEDENGTYYQLTDYTYTMDAPTEQDASDYIGGMNAKKYKRTATAEVTHLDEAAPYNVTAAVDAGGRLSFTGLGAGNYVLTETVTPSGYHSIEPIAFQIQFGWDGEQERYEFYSEDAMIGQGRNNTLMIEIENKAGSTLPETGGIGTTLFYVFGGIMVAGAAVLLVTKKRMGTV